MPRSNSRSKNARGRHNGAAHNHSTHNAAAMRSELTDVITPYCMDSISRAGELQKNAVTLAAEQAGDWIGACKDVLSHFPMSPPSLFFDLAAQAVQMSAETQKSAVDFVVQQTEMMTDMAKERNQAYSQVAESATSAFAATMTRSVEAQKRVLESASQQNKAIFAATRRKVGNGPGSALVDSFERGADTMVKAQKSILEATAQPFMTGRD